MKPIFKKSMWILLGLVAVVVVEKYAYRRTRYVGVVTCRFKTETSCFGMLVSTTDERDENTDYLASLVGDIPERQYVVCGRDTLLFWMHVGTPQGNWFWVRMLKREVASGLKVETAIRWARELVSEDVSLRERAIQEIREYEMKRSD